MKNTLQFLCFTFVLTLGTSCYQDVDDSTETPLPNDPLVLIDGKVLVELSDANGDLVNNYEIEIKDNIQLISQNVWFGDLKKVPKKNALFLFKKDDKIQSIVNHSLFLNHINYINALAFPLAESISTNTTDLDQKSINNIGSLNFSTTQFIDQNQNLYTGNLKVHTNQISDIDLLTQMCQVAFDFENQYIKVDASNAFEIRLTQPNGSELNTTESILLNIENDLLGQSLFFLNTESSRWEIVSESLTEQTSLSQTGYYIFGTSASAHFIEGNISLEDRFINKANLTFQNTNKTILKSHSTEQGSWAAFVPNDQEISVSVIDDCNTEIKGFNLSVDAPVFNNLNIEVETKTIGQVELINCLGETVNDNVMIALKGNEKTKFVIPVEGSEILSCYEDFELTTYDNSALDQLTTMNWDNSLDKNINIISACSGLSMEFGYLKIRGDRKVFETRLEQSSMDESIFEDVDGKIQLKFKGNQINDYLDQEVNLSILDPNFGEDGYRLNCSNTTQGCGIDVFEVTQFDVNGEIRIYFEGNIWMQTISPPAAGYFDIQGLIFINN